MWCGVVEAQLQLNGMNLRIRWDPKIGIREFCCFVHFGRGGLMDVVTCLASTPGRLFTDLHSFVSLLEKR